MKGEEGVDTCYTPVNLLMILYILFPVYVLLHSLCNRYILILYTTYPCAPLATTVTSRHFMFTLSPVPSSRADDLHTPLPSIHLI